MPLERVAKARDVAVPEDGKHPGKEWSLGAVDDDSLGDEVADDCLGGRDADGGNLLDRGHDALTLRSRTLSQVREVHESMSACCTLTTSTASANPGVNAPPVARDCMNA